MSTTTRNKSQEHDMYLVMKHLLMEAGADAAQWSSTSTEVSVYNLTVETLDRGAVNIHVALNDTHGEVIGIVDPPFATTR